MKGARTTLRVLGKKKIARRVSSVVGIDAFWALNEQA
jgi:hypothetical protein